MIRVLPYVIEIAVLVYCLVDAIQSDESEVRNLSKGWWIVLIIFMPVVGGVAWLVAGRPVRARRRAVPWPSGTAGYPERERPRPLAPEDDPAFLASLRQADAEHERMLAQWEDDLKRREEQLRRDGPPAAADRPAGPDRAAGQPSDRPDAPDSGGQPSGGS